MAPVHDNCTQLQYSCTARYIYTDEKPVRFIFYKVINDDVKKEILKQPLKSTITKEGGAIEYSIELETFSKRKTRFYDLDCIGSESSIYPLISEKITISVDSRWMKELIDRGEIIKMNLGMDKDFNYFRVPIALRSYLSFVSSYEATFENGAPGYTIFFEDLIEKHIIKLSDEDKKKCIKELNNLLTLSSEKLADTYKGKLFLLLEENLSLLKPVIRCFKDLIEVEKNPKEFLEETIFEMENILSSINLGKFMPILEKEVGSLYPSGTVTDLKSIAISHGVITDILNICRYAVDNRVKFDIYEVFDHYEKLKFSCCLDIRIRMRNYDPEKFESANVRTNSNMRLFYECEELRDGFIIKVLFNPGLGQRPISAICVDVMYSSMPFTTDFINLHSAINGELC